MSNVELHDAAQRGLKAKGTEGVEALIAYWAPEIVFNDYGRGLTMNGKEAATAWLTGWKTAFSDLRIEDATYRASGDWTVVQFTARGTNDGPFGEVPATGRAADLPCCELIRWQDGKAHEGALYYDTTSLLVQLGLMPAPM